MCVVGSQLEGLRCVNLFCDPAASSLAAPGLLALVAARVCFAYDGFVRKMRLLPVIRLAVPIGAVALSSLAGEAIKGAFGSKLGDVFDPSSSIRTVRTADGTPEGAPIYEFSPATRFGLFHHYYVRITPATHKIWSLEAVRDVEDKEATQKEQDM